MPLRAALVCASFLLSVACATGGSRADSGSIDASSRDAGTSDGGAMDSGAMDGGAPDSGPPDSGPPDSGPPDSGPPDSGPPDSGPPDSGPPDSGPPDGGPPDSGPPDSGPPDSGPGGTPVRFECVPAVLGNETMSGITLTSNFWSGFRFEVPAGPAVTTTSIEINVKSSSGGGTFFGGLIRLTGASDQPDTPNLTGADVLGITTLTHPGGSLSVTVAAPLAVTLTPGWYAVQFGTGAMGATLPSGTIHSNSGLGRCELGGPPFTFRQTDGMFILQGAAPHFAVDAVTP